MDHTASLLKYLQSQRLDIKALSMMECERLSGGDIQGQEFRPESYCQALEAGFRVWGRPAMSK